MRAIRQLPGNKQAALAIDLHAVKSLVEAGNHTAHALGKSDGLARSLLRLTIVAHHRLPVLVYNRGSGMVKRGVELAPVGGQPAGVVNDVHLVGLGQRAGADFGVLVAQRKGAPDDAVRRWHSGGQLDPRHSRGRFGGGGGLGGGCGLGGGLGDCNGAESRRMASLRASAPVWFLWGVYQRSLFRA